MGIIAELGIFDNASSWSFPGYWKDVIKPSGDPEKPPHDVAYIHSFPAQTSADLWEDYYFYSRFGYPSGGGPRGGVLFRPWYPVNEYSDYWSFANTQNRALGPLMGFSFAFKASFSGDISVANTPEPAIPIAVTPDLANRRLRVRLAGEPENECELIWHFPFSIRSNADDTQESFGLIAARHVLTAWGAGSWDAVYSGDPQDREPELEWGGSAYMIHGRFPSFESYIDQWFRPTLTELVCATSGLKIIQQGKGYKIEFYRRDQIGGKNAAGRYTFSGDPIETFTVENNDDEGNLVITAAASGVTYELDQLSQTLSDWQIDETHWKFTAKKSGGIFFEQELIAEEPEWDEGLVVVPYRITDTTKLDGQPLPTVTTTYWDSWANEDRIDQVDESGSENRITTHTYARTPAGKITHRTGINQTGGPNPYQATYNDAGLITSYISGPRQILWDYSGNLVTRTEKFSGTTERTVKTVYSNGMARAVTTVDGVSNAVPAIVEYDSKNAANPWGLKMERGFDGALTTFTSTKQGNEWVTEMRSGRGENGTSESVTAGTRTVTKVNAAGKLTSTEVFDIEGNAKLDFANAASFQSGTPFPSKYSRPLNSAEEFIYDGQGRVTSYKDRLGKTTTYDYDGLGRLKQAIGGGLTWTINHNPGHLGTKITCTGAGSTRTWEETTSPFGTNYTLAISGPQNVTLSRTETAATITTTENNTTTKQSWTETTTKNSLQRTLTGNAVRLTNNSGEAWTTIYSPSNGRWTTSNNQASGGLTTFVEFDPIGRIKTRQDRNPSGSGTVDTAYNYASGRLTSTNGPGGTTTYEYQPDGSLGKVARGERVISVSRVSSSSSQIKWEWKNGAGETIHERIYYPATGKVDDLPWAESAQKIATTPTISGGTFTLSAIASGLGSATRSWNQHGTPIAGSLTRGSFTHGWTTTQSNGLGEVTALLEKPGGIGSGRTWQFSSLGLPTNIGGLGGLGATSISANPFQSNGDFAPTMTRDSKSVTTRSSPMGIGLSEVGYGEPDQSWGYPSVLGSAVARNLTTDADTVTFQWNPAGTFKQRAFPGGATESFVYNSAGAMTSWTPPGASALSLNPNAFGQPRQVGTLVSGITYDKAGRLESWTDAAGTHTRAYFQGEVAKEIHSGGVLGGQRVDRSHDAAGRLKKVAPSGDGKKKIDYTYDGNGKLATVKTAGGLTATYSNYDPVSGRAKTITISGGASSLTITTGLDALGRVTSRTNPAGGGTYNYGYDAYGLCNSATGLGTIGYDGNGYLNGTSQSGGSYSYAWRESGAPLGASGYRPPLRTNASQVEVFGSYNRNYSVYITINDYPVVQDSVNGTFSKTYNAGPGGGWMTFDIVGRITGAGHNGSAAVAQEIRHVYTSPASENLGYDAAGNRSSDARWYYQWNALGQLTDAWETTPQDPDAYGWISFTYDGAGRLMEKRVYEVLTGDGPQLQGRTTFLYDGWKLLREVEYKGSNQELRRRVYSWGTDVSGTIDGAAGIGGLLEVLETRKGGAETRNIVIDDGMGNVVGLIDAATGTRSAVYKHGPFGEVEIVTGSRAASCPLRYQTKYWDETLGLYYWNKRWYDPRTRTFLSMDPIREAGGIALYGLCNNQPIGNHDPIGLKPTEQIHDEFYAGLEKNGITWGLTVGMGRFIVDVMDPFAGDSPFRETREQVHAGIPVVLSGIDDAPLPVSVKSVVKIPIGAGLAGEAVNPLNATADLIDFGSLVRQEGWNTPRVIAQSAIDNPEITLGALAVGVRFPKGFRAAPRTLATVPAWRFAEVRPAIRALRGEGLPSEKIREAILSFQPGTLKTRTLLTDEYAIRLFGGKSGPISPYLGPTFPGGDARSLLAPTPGNTLQKIKQWRIPTGTTILEGRIAGANKQFGGGYQIFVPHPETTLQWP